MDPSANSYEALHLAMQHEHTNVYQRLARDPRCLAMVEDNECYPVVHRPTARQVLLHFSKKRILIEARRQFACEQYTMYRMQFMLGTELGNRISMYFE